MSIRADHYDAVPVLEKSPRLLPISYTARRKDGVAFPSRATAWLSENETHSYIRQAIIEQKTFTIQMADGLSAVTFSGRGSDLLVEHSYGAGHHGMHALCVGSWIVWEIFRGCPSATLSELLAYIPSIDTPLLQPV